MALATFGWAQGTQTPAKPAVQMQKLINPANTPTASDMYCGGFIASEKVPSNRSIVAGWNSPDQTRYANPVNDYVYIHGRDIKEGDKFEIVRHVKDPNQYEFYAGERAAIRELGEPYFELGYVKVINVQRDTAIALPVLSCADFVIGDLAIPFVERQAPVFRKVSFERFEPLGGRTQGRIVMGNEFDNYLGNKKIAYINLGEDRGIKVGDYLRVTRTYTRTYSERESNMSQLATAVEDNQADAYKVARPDVSGLPLRTLGDMIVLQVHRKSATVMIVSALEDIHVGDSVELMDTSSAAEEQPLVPVSSVSPSTEAAPAFNPPQIACSASPATVKTGETSTITCDASSPDNRPLSITFVSNGGKLSTSRNQAKLDTSDVGPGPIAVRATAFDDRQLSASASTTVNVQAPPAPQSVPQKMIDMDFKPTSAYVDNRSKAVLDDVALKMQQDPTSTALIIGSADEKETPGLAQKRAENVKAYLTASKGIDPQRLQTKTGTTPGRNVQIWTVPAGATAPQ